MKLSSGDRALLISLYESDEYKALKRFNEARKIDVATLSLNSSSMEDLWIQKGRVFEIDWQERQLQDLYKKHMNKGKEK